MKTVRRYNVSYPGQTTKYRMISGGYSVRPYDYKARTPIYAKPYPTSSIVTPYSNYGTNVIEQFKYTPTRYTMKRITPPRTPPYTPPQEYRPNIPPSEKRKGKKRKPKDVAFEDFQLTQIGYVPDFTARVLGFGAQKVSKKQAIKITTARYDPFQTRRGIKIR